MEAWMDGWRSWVGGMEWVRWEVRRDVLGGSVGGRGVVDGEMR